MFLNENEWENRVYWTTINNAIESVLILIINLLQKEVLSSRSSKINGPFAAKWAEIKLWQSFFYCPWQPKQDWCS